jgi:molecular chaperone DnaK
VGIDLGTTYSLVAHLDSTGRPWTVLNAEGDITTPSVVFFDKTSVVVGKEAVKVAEFEPELIAQFVKRDMGRKSFQKTIRGEQLPPEVIQALILKKLKQDAELKLGNVSKAVVTVPAYFNEPMRKATQDAGRLAGIDVLDIINEPTAAAISYGVQQGFLNAKGESQRRETVLIYDLGGGTFDATLMDIDGHNYNAIATLGDVYLGGIDWDQRIVEFVADEFQKQHGFDPRSNASALQVLMSEAADAKHSLSVRDEVTIHYSHDGHRIRLNLTREQFETMTGDLLDRTLLTLRKLLRESNRQWSDITRLLLVGGSTRMPMIQKMLEEESGLPLNRSLSPDEGVAHGAAIYAGLLIGATAITRHGMSVANVNSHDLSVLGIESATGLKRRQVMIPRNTSLPAIGTNKFKTYQENQKNVAVNVIEGGDASGNGATRIGKCIVSELPEVLPAKTPIEVVFQYSQNGRLAVKAWLPTINREAHLTIERASGLSESQLEYWTHRIDGGFTEIAERPAIEQRDAAPPTPSEGQATVQTESVIETPADPVAPPEPPQASELPQIRAEIPVQPPQETAPESDTPATAEPEAITQEAVEPEADTSEQIQPETIAPEVTTPETVEPVATAPEAVAPETVTPDATTPDTAVPESVTRKLIEPEAIAPEADTTEPVAPESAEPETVAQESATPEIVESEFAIPTLIEPKPAARKPVRPKRVKRSRRKKTVAGESQNHKNKTTLAGRLLAHIPLFAGLSPKQRARNLKVWGINAGVHILVLVILASIILPSPEEDVFALINSTFVTDEQPEQIEQVEVEQQEIDDTKMEVVNDILFDSNDQFELDINDLDPSALMPELKADAPWTMAPKGNETGGRSKAGRTALVNTYGGTAASESAVNRALAWLVRHQAADGSWSFDHTGGDCAGKCTQPGSLAKSKMGATSLAILAFLAAGNTYSEGDFQPEVGKALQYMFANAKQTRAGLDLRGAAEGNSGMYIQGMATMALCEALAMTDLALKEKNNDTQLSSGKRRGRRQLLVKVSKQLRTAAQQAIFFVMNAQDTKTGSWGYKPATAGDTSITGWQVMAMVSAAASKLSIRPQVYQHTTRFLNSVQIGDGAGYGYKKPEWKPSTTAIGLLCRMYMGWKKDRPAMQQGVEFLSKQGPSKNNIYYNYYATQVLYHSGGEAWKKWNDVMRDQLVNSQIKTGHASGSWDATIDAHGRGPGGRLYTTCMATMTLEVYYRHLPLYRHFEDEKNGTAKKVAEN